MRLINLIPALFIKMRPRTRLAFLVIAFAYLYNLCRQRPSLVASNLRESYDYVIGELESSPSWP
jgi:hypothetical protein